MIPLPRSQCPIHGFGWKSTSPQPNPHLTHTLLYNILLLRIKHDHQDLSIVLVEKANVMSMDLMD